MTRLGLLIAVFIAGCGPSGPKIYQVSGTVTFEGRLVPKGVITFEPDGRHGNNGPQGYAVITDGHYTTAGTDGRGVVGGAYIIRIDGYDGVPGRELPLGKPLFRTVEILREFQVDVAEQNFDVKK